MAANVVSLSFKNNSDEINMYNYLKSKSSPSAYIKELIKQDLGDNNVYSNKVDGNTNMTNKNMNEEKKEPVAVNKISNMSSIFK